jgi:8-oxo-dGTP pyrophosphatase MutT (NUDIX family)
MVRRHEQSSFGAAHAFPGGVVDPEDAEVHEFCEGLTGDEVNSRLGVKADGLSYYSAAVRELFEEAGVLFADFSNLDENRASIRNALNDRSMNWAEFVNQNELSLHCGKFHYFSHWVTPETMAKRYSTRFFLAELPQGQIAEHCGGELTDSCWATASDTLAASRRGDVKLHYPTIKTLESVARHHSMVELVDWARSCVEWGITSMIPMMIQRNGKSEIVLPGDKDYPGAKS